jgi:phosphoribosylformylglycinamidine cyclo-ligase
MADSPLTYASSGVNIDEAQRALREVRANILATHGANVMGGIGSFGALYKASFPGIENPVLVSSVDGVGTKTKIAAQMGQFGGLGIDIVNHCVNDILCQGARPLFFLDYYGCSRLSGLVFEDILLGMVEACREVGMALIGGETAEMPGVYVEDEIDIVGSIVGVVDHDRRLPRGKPKPGDAVIGIASSGLHTNGYSLARRSLLEIGGMSLRDQVPGLGRTIGEELLRPHKCYFNAVYPILQEVEEVTACAHITGGGLYDNVPRVIPVDLRIMIERRSWTTPPIFQLIQSVGNIPDHEMYRAFNMGIGMVLVCDRMVGPALVQRLQDSGESAFLIGEVQDGPHDVQIM